MTCPTPIELCATRGSDVSLTITISDADGPVDLTSQSVSVFDVVPSLEGRVTAAITDAAAGRITVDIEGTDPIDIGRHVFRLRLSGAGDSVGLPPFVLGVV